MEEIKETKKKKGKEDKYTQRITMGECIFSSIQRNLKLDFVISFMHSCASVGARRELFGVCKKIMRTFRPMHMYWLCFGGKSKIRIEHKFQKNKTHTQ